MPAAWTSSLISASRNPKPKAIILQYCFYRTHHLCHEAISTRIINKYEMAHSPSAWTPAAFPFGNPPPLRVISDHIIRRQHIFASADSAHWLRAVSTATTTTNCAIQYKYLIWHQRFWPAADLMIFARPKECVTIIWLFRRECTTLIPILPSPPWRTCVLVGWHIDIYDRPSASFIRKENIISASILK